MRTTCPLWLRVVESQLPSLAALRIPPYLPSPHSWHSVVSLRQEWGGLQKSQCYHSSNDHHSTTSTPSPWTRRLSQRQYPGQPNPRSIVPSSTNRMAPPSWRPRLIWACQVQSFRPISFNIPAGSSALQIFSRYRHLMWPSVRKYK